jgi:hypothetical protein
MKSRLILAALLLAAPLLNAQDNDKKIEAQKVEITLAPAKEAAPAQKTPEEPHEPYRITINFKTTDGAKTTTKKIYTLLATTDQSLPSIRDDNNVPFKTGSNNYQYYLLKTDVDIRRFKKVDKSVYLSLSINTVNVTNDDAAQAQNLTTTHNHEYVLSPTLPIGKLTTVYTAVDAINETKVEIEVLVEPLDGK